MRPWCASTIRLAMANPTPVPGNLLATITMKTGDCTCLPDTVLLTYVGNVGGAEAWEGGRFSEVNERTFRLARKGARVMAFSSPLVETASVLAFLLLLGYATARITAGKMTLGTFISYGVGLAMMYQPFKRATRTNLALQQARVVVLRPEVEAAGKAPRDGVRAELREQKRGSPGKTGEDRVELL